MTVAQKKDLALQVIGLLEKQYPDAKCSLEYSQPHELLIATRLSAQCTDARVNIVTKELFAKFHTIEEFADADIADMTANLIMGDIYHKPAVVTDTHCIRITGRLGLVKSKEPAKVEQELWKILPPDKSNDLCHRLVLFGREFCTARSPKCAGCPLGDICVSKSE